MVNCYKFAEAFGWDYDTHPICMEGGKAGGIASKEPNPYTGIAGDLWQYGYDVAFEDFQE